MNDYFVNITQTIGLKQFQLDHLNNLFEDHANIRIKSNLDNVSDKFDFKKCMRKKSTGNHEFKLKKSSMSRCYTSQNS